MAIILCRIEIATVYSGLTLLSVKCGGQSRGTKSRTFGTTRFGTIEKPVNVNSMVIFVTIQAFHQCTIYMEKVFKKFCFRFSNYFLRYIIQIIFIVFNIYSVDEGELQRDEVAIYKVIVIYVLYTYWTGPGPIPYLFGQVR